jgi:hypothetical protein
MLRNILSVSVNDYQGFVFTEDNYFTVAVSDEDIVSAHAVSELKEIIDISDDTSKALAEWIKEALKQTGYVEVFYNDEEDTFTVYAVKNAYTIE